MSSSRVSRLLKTWMPRPYLTSVAYPVEEGWLEQPEVARVLREEHLGDEGLAVVERRAAVWEVAATTLPLDQHPKLAILYLEFGGHIELEEPQKCVEEALEGTVLEIEDERRGHDLEDVAFGRLAVLGEIAQ